ncbi:MAG: hypothetical protein WC612_01085 [Bdellovibrionales bacterium]
MALSPLGAAEKTAQASAGGASIVLRTGQHPLFDRVVFDAPVGMGYKIERAGERVVVRFSKAAKAVLPPSKLDRAKGFQVLAGGDGSALLAVSFSIAAQATLKDFISDRSIVIDVTGPQARVVALPSPDLPPPPVQKQPPAVEASPPATAAVAAATPAVQETVKEEEPPPQEEAKKQDLPPEPVEGEKALPESLDPVPAPAPLETVEAKQAEPAPSQPALNWPLASETRLDAKTENEIRTITQEHPPQPVAVFDPKIEVGTAIFARAGYVNIIFDRKLVGDALLTSPPPRVKLEPIALQRQTGFRIAVPDQVSVRATRKGTAWEIYLVPQGETALLSTEFLSQPNFALGARLLLPSANPPEPVMLRDPVVGDDLIVIPFKETGAFTLKRRLSDFLVIPAVQGLVIKPWHEKVTARIVPDGIEISAEGGLKLSPLRDMGRDPHRAYKGGANEKPLFDFERWRGQEGETFTQTQQKLMQTVIAVSEEERVLPRLDLARLYFSHGMGYEALALLELIRKALPEIEVYPDFLALRGAVRLLTGRVQEGLADLSQPALKDQADIVLWRAYGAALSRDFVSARELFNLSRGTLEQYGDPLFSQFVILATESALALDQDKEATEWLYKLEAKESLSPAALSATRYLRGVLYSKSGQAEKAEALWKQVVRGADRLYKIRAELALIDLGVATKSLTPKQAVDRLEGLRYAWRGDDLELDILKRLGGYYLEAKDFKAGFAVLSQALRLFPSSPQTTALRTDMIKTFHDVYMTDLGRDMSPIDALSLYTDHQDLIPAGEEGNDVRSNLAERLVDIDLLDQAAKLLEALIKNSTKPEEKAQTLTRLAGVRLLDHKAEAALALLDQSQGDAATLSQKTKDERQLLRARALSEMGKYQEALAALPEGSGQSTLLLRADMALRAKQWGDATKALLALVGPLKAGVSLNEEQATWLVHAVVAMAQAGDLTGLDHAAAEYGAAMDKTSKAGVFHVLTSPEKMTGMKDIYAVQGRLSDVDMFRSVLDSYRKDKKN